METYLYSLFMVTTNEDLVYRMTVGTVIYGILTFFIPFDVPYGKFSAKWAGFGIPVKLAWVIQESPAFFIPVYYFIREYQKEYSLFMQSLPNLFCLGLFILHYFQRSFIYVYLMKSQTATPFLPFVAAFLTCTYNGILHGLYFTTFQLYQIKGFMKITHIFGLLLFFFGMLVNIHSDSILRNLRNTKNQGYKIPYGGFFKFVSCANYFGEITEMFGYALASLAPPAAAFSIFTALFLTRRGLQNHRWYQKKFEDYPKDRKAVIPFLV